MMELLNWIADHGQTAFVMALVGTGMVTGIIVAVGEAIGRARGHKVEEE